MKIFHLGAESCVTGSCHLLQVGGLNILIDCGLAQGRDRPAPMAEWPVPPAKIDYLFVTHAHVDHIGRLPELVQNGFAGEIIATPPTQALLLPMLRDAMRFSDLSEKEATRLGSQIDKLTWGFEYGKVFDLEKGVQFKLGRAGHILGSCFIHFLAPQHGCSVIFSGDLGDRETPIQIGRASCRERV